VIVLLDFILFDVAACHAYSCLAKQHELCDVEPEVVSNLAVAATQARNAAAKGRLDREPMFCFETAVKLFFWSCLVYEDYEGVSVLGGGVCCRSDVGLC
jgi:hypothetical protein